MDSVAHAGAEIHKPCLLKQVAEDPEEAGLHVVVCLGREHWVKESLPRSQLA